METTRGLVERLLVLLGSRRSEEDQMEVLAKSGHLWRVDSNGKWVRRWFELRQDVLASYKAEDRTKLKNAIKVSKITKIELCDNVNFVMTCGNSKYPFKGESADDAADWVRVISNRLI